VPTDHELFNLPDPKTQGLMTVEGIDMILRLWEAQAPFDFEGKFWRMGIRNPVPELGVGTMVKPYQKPHPPIAMSVIQGNSLAGRMAGARGYIPISTNMAPASTAARHWATYCLGAAEAGRPLPARSNWRISRGICVADSNREAWEHARNGSFAESFCYLITMLKLNNMLQLMKHDPAVPDSDVTPEYALKHLSIIGDPAECIRQLRILWDETGGFGTLLMIAQDWDDKSKWVRSMELLAREVLPALPSI
jgi:alkanesulfonate monooxygenase SsuD/methylene tetrahydromethanopterin reductase-like flavin-dependent oxidoreductase (luciferase family)